MTTILASAVVDHAVQKLTRLPEEDVSLVLEFINSSDSFSLT